ncbi:MAG: 4'-phosphopantetheinyl transferase superfamily protein [Clostridia bacterium]|nr:4'-phosphopantetheinyl transferase superfamily protein [Clostridia bacterium]
MKETVALFVSVNPAETSHTLLRRAASLLTGSDESEFDTAKAAQGKPYFPAHPGLHFSVSHSGDYWICAFASREIGCDIQLHTEPKRPDAIVNRYFHPAEQAVYAASEDKPAAFHRIWCRKEAAVKRTGHGIDRTFAETDTTSPDCGVTDLVLPGADGYSCAIAYDGEFVVDIRYL